MPRNYQLHQHHLREVKGPPSKDLVVETVELPLEVGQVVETAELPLEVGQVVETAGDHQLMAEEADQAVGIVAPGNEKALVRLRTLSMPQRLRQRVLVPKVKQ